MNYVRSILIGVVISNLSVAGGQTLDKELSEAYLDSVNQVMGINKKFDPDFIKASLLAIQHYPELKNARIVFKKKNIATLMAARPSLASLFKKRSKRTYVIVVSSNSKRKSRIIFREMSVRAQTGLIGHEYAHLTDYEKMNNFQLIVFGLEYLLRKRKIERNTDLLTIQHGLGDELLEFNRYIRNNKHSSKKYLQNKKKNYLSVTEIIQLTGGVVLN